MPAQSEYDPIKTKKHSDGVSHAADLIEELEKESGEYSQSAYAQNSKKTASTSMRAFIMFMITIGCVHQVLNNGVDDAILCAYITFLARSLKYSSIKTYVTMGVRLLHLQEALPWTPIKDRWNVVQTMRGIRRKKGDVTEQKQPISPHMLINMKQYILSKAKDSVCVWAAILVAFFLMLRKSNVATDKPQQLADRTPIKMCDLKIVESEGIWIRLRHTKTIQYKERELWLLLPMIKGSELCPTQALYAHITINRKGATGEEPLFATSKGSLKYSSLLGTIKKALEKCGYDPKKYAGHSLRRGGATWAFTVCEMQADMIKTIGDWRSEAYRLYAKVTDAMKRKSAAMMASAIANSRLGEHQPTSEAGIIGTNLDVYNEEE